MTTAPNITQLEMTERDIEFAEEIAARLGFTQTAYTTSSALWGLFCLRDNPEHIGRHVWEPISKDFDPNCRKCGGKYRDSVHAVRTNYAMSGCIIKTAEFGFMFVADLEDLQAHDLNDEQRTPAAS